MQTKDPELKKRLRIMLIALGILFGGMLFFHLVKTLMMKWYFATHGNPIITVSATDAQYSLWQSELKSTGNIRAIKGVQVTTEIGGMVQFIYFKPGAIVKKGATLVQLNADPDIALLHSLQATAEFAEITYKRDKSQLAIQAVSQQTVDSDRANLKSSVAQVAEQQATVAKKTITAPFDGRLGICVVNPGQYLNPGEKIVNLEMYDPIYIDFYIPQQDIQQVKLGQEIKV